MLDTTEIHKENHGKAIKNIKKVWYLSMLQAGTLSGPTCKCTKNAQKLGTAQKVLEMGRSPKVFTPVYMVQPIMNINVTHMGQILIK